MSDDLFPSGPWVGFYTYTDRPGRHRMDLALTFAKAMLTGEGTDDLSAFIIRGRYDANTKTSEVFWQENLVGEHQAAWVWGLGWR
jgi:hypothetical protein